MNLVIDIGNTRVKAAIFNGAELKEFKVYPHVNELIKDPAFYVNTAHVIVSSVTQDHLLLISHFSDKKFLLFENGTPIPIKNLYKSASTLGSDRIAASLGAFCFFPDSNVLTIDAGTCIKYNFVNNQNEFIGGAISPGLSMRLKALNHFTSALPLIEKDYNYDKLTGTDTRESILSGALVGAAAEVECMIARYEADYENLKIVLTGGDSDYLCKQLKNRFFAHPYIVLYGLNKILNHHLEK